MPFPWQSLLSLTGFVAFFWLGRVYERRRIARAQALVAPMLKLGIDAFNRADAAQVHASARRTDHRFRL